MEDIVIKDSLKITPMQVGGNRSMVQLILDGYLDTYNSPDFQNHINSLISAGVDTILFNCSGLNYISSTGIGAFTSFFKQLKKKKGDMVLFGLQNKVTEVFHLLGFTRFFKIAHDLDGALRLVERGTEARSTPMQGKRAASQRKPPGGSGRAASRGASSARRASPAISTESSTSKLSKVNAAGGMGVFPAVISCPHCHRKLVASKQGKFRCSSCRGIIRVDRGGIAHPA